METKTGVIGAVLMAVIILSSFGYLVHRNRLNSTLSELDITFNRVEVKSLRLLPKPEANLTLIYVANNTKGVEFSISMDGELYYGSYFITPLTIKDTLIGADGLSTLQVDVMITGSILHTIDPEKRDQYKLEGELVASSSFLGIVPVKVTKPLSDYLSDQA